jgi:uncharacterized membrane protein YphA (DoxX/SURF4 family)
MKINVKNSNKLASLLLRLGLASVLLYASVASFMSPQDWVGYLPHFLTSHFSGHLLLHGFSVYEMALAVWLLSGVYLRYASILAALTFAVTFRDITMVFASLALIFIKVD